MDDTTTGATERGWMTMPGWTTAHLVAPGGNGWRSNCGRYVSVEPAPADMGMRRCSQCEEPRGNTWQRPTILPRQQPSRASRS